MLIQIETFVLMIGAFFTARTRTFIPVDGKPGQILEDPALKILRCPDGIRIFNPQNEFAAIMPGKHPVEQGRPGIPYVKITRW